MPDAGAAQSVTETPAAAAGGLPVPPAALSGFTTGPLIDGEDQGNAAAPSSATQLIGLSTDLRWAIEQSGESPYLPKLPEGRGGTPQPMFRNAQGVLMTEPVEQSPMLSAADATTKYGIPGRLTFDSPVPDAVAQLRHQAATESAKLDEIAARRPDGVWEWIKSQGAGAVTSLTDPGNIALMFVPPLAEARYGAWLAERGVTGFAGRAGARFLAGATVGAAGQVPLEALRYRAAGDIGEDWSMSQALLDIAYGGLGFGALHAGEGLVRDLFFPQRPAATIRPDITRIATASPATHEAALRTALAQTVADRPVEVSPIFAADEARQMAAMPNISPEDFRVLSETSGLQARDAQLAQRLQVLPEGDASAADRLNRLGAVERQLGNSDLAPADRAALMQRRDQILVDTTPEALQAAAEPIAERASIARQREAIAARLTEIEGERARAQAQAALSPFPTVEGGPSVPVAIRPAAPVEPATEAMGRPNLGYRPFRPGEVPPAVQTLIDNAAQRPTAEALALRSAGDAAGRDPMAQVTEKAPANERGVAARRRPPPARGESSLLQFIASKGGMKDQGGELASMDLDKDRAGKPLRGAARRVVNPRGMDLDEATLQAQQAGYIGNGAGLGPASERTAEVPPATRAELLEAIRREAGGEKVYPIGAESRGLDVRTNEDLRQQAIEQGHDAELAWLNEALPAPLAEQLASAERMVREAEAAGTLDPKEDLPALKAVDDYAAKTVQIAKMIRAAALCLEGAEG